MRADDQISLLKLDNGQHLKTSFHGTLKNSKDNQEIISLLHPTPAVAGHPKNDALKAIERIEPFNRGWYAAPVGYIGYDETEFAVAIRSGLVNKKTLSLFAGAGIVDGSTAHDEWEEIEHKMGSFIKVFNQKKSQ
mgnify:CR=1 FL=1